MAMRKIAPVLIGTLAALLAWVPGAVAVPVIDGHFPTSETGTNKKIAAGPDGNMWVTVNGGGKDVARISPAGKVDEFELEGVAAPTGIAVDPEGRVWVTQGGGVASFLAHDPKGTSKPTPIPDVKDPASIVAGPNGEMWVASAGSVVHFPPTNPAGFKSIPVAGLSPKDIDVAGSLLVIADSGNKRVLTMTTAGITQDYSLLDETATSQGVAGNPNGQFAFSKADTDEGLGLLTPPGPATAARMAGDPFGVALGSDGAYWFAMSAANNLQRLTADGTATPLNGMPQFPGPAEFFPRQIAAGPNNTLWVTLEVPGENVYEVARVSGLELPVNPGGDTKPPATPPETTIDKGPKKKVTIHGKARRARVKFRFSSTTPGATFECALVRKPAKKGAKFPRPVFRACKSPDNLRLRRGRYRFSVRAVRGGLVDPTPASQAFRVVRAPRK